MSIIASSAFRFAVVGIAVTLLHVAVAAGLIELARAHPALANGVAFIVANFVSYVANTHWSFRARMSLERWRRFVGVSLVAWLLTLAISAAVAEAGGHYLLGIALVLVVVPLANYVGHRFYTYRPLHQLAGTPAAPRQSID
jgi:putative flippase GtrA